MVFSITILGYCINFLGKVRIFVNLSLSDWSSIATIVGSLIALAALLYTTWQVVQNTNVNRATFWLELRKMFADHQDIHVELRDGSWETYDDNDPDKWPPLEAYMGLFEHCMIMLDKGLIDWQTFQRIYEYRLHNIVVVPEIVGEKLIKRGNNWQDFIQLVMNDHLHLKQDVLATAAAWLSTNEAENWIQSEEFQWFGSDDGKEWLRSPVGKQWKELTGYAVAV
jgi:hypothetical protein